MRGRGLGALPASVRLPISLMTLAILLSVQGIAYVNKASFESYQEDGIEVQVYGDVDEKPFVDVQPHVDGAYYADDAVEEAPSLSAPPSGILAVWGLAAAAVGTLLGALLAIGFGMYSLIEAATVSEEEEITAESWQR